ncbi:MAG TPA: cohesin domain-containing protein, partial [Thermoanaerobaculia bacterium]|nr:cohesin domain-containing protein [Thermoanaerobaculia bacterium]
AGVRWERGARGVRGRAAGLLLFFALAACGGGGGGGGGPTQPTPTPPPQASLVFTPQGGGDTGVALAAGAGSTATTLILEVRASSVTDLYGVAFDLSYPANLVQYVRTTQGPLLAGGTLQVATSGGGTSGTLVVGLSNLGPVPGASGSGVLMTLEFRAAGAGQGSFSFTRNVAVDSAGQSIDGLSWGTGTVRVTL